jgi:hypothetical protein
VADRPDEGAIRNFYRLEILNGVARWADKSFAFGKHAVDLWLYVICAASAERTIF